MEVIDQSRGAPGGDVIFKPGKGQDGTEIMRPGRDGSIRFLLPDDTEMLAFHPDGTIYVRGELVEDNVTVYNIFKRWLMTATAERGW